MPLFSVRTDKEELDGVTPDQLRQWAAAGRVTPNDLVRPAGTQRWHRADAVQGLFSKEQIVLDDEPHGDGAHRPEHRDRRTAIPKKKPRFLFALVLAIVPIATCTLIPAISLWIGVALVCMALLYIIPQARKPISAIYRVSPARPVRTGIKLVTLGSYGVILIGLSSVGANIKEQARIAEEARLAREAEEARLIAAANAEVVARVDEARAMLRAGEIEGAGTKLEAAVSVRKATNKTLAIGLLGAIQDSGNAEHVLEALVSLPENELTAFRDENITPAALTFDFEVLTQRAVALAKSRIDGAIELRAERERQRIAAEEERRKREAEERERSRLAEEVKRQREVEKRERERAAAEARRKAAQQEIQDKLDAYMAVLKLAEVRIVESVSVRRIGGSSWEATLTVSNLWHLRHKQIRLQDAQSLWEAWATIASPKEPDSARIKLVDLRGNEVGGSRVWGGSLIWVKD